MRVDSALWEDSGVGVRATRGQGAQDSRDVLERWLLEAGPDLGVDPHEQ